MKNKYVLRWQYGVFAGDTRTHYTYGSLDMLKYKAKYLVENEDICFFSWCDNGITPTKPGLYILG